MKTKKTILVSVIISAILFVCIGFIGTKVKDSKKLLPANKVYAETVSEIETDMTNLMAEIQSGMKTNPELAMLGHPGEFIKNSESYQKIVGLGLTAVKPLYDKLYDSRDAGLYEYILAMAVEDITKETFVYNVDYGWKNSIEFRLAYEEKVNNVEFNVEKIVNDSSLSDSDKLNKLSEQGIFAVSSLMKDYNSKEFSDSKVVIGDSIKSIVLDYQNSVGYKSRSTSEDIDVENLIDQNADLFDSIVELNGKAYE